MRAALPESESILLPENNVIPFPERRQSVLRRGKAMERFENRMCQSSFGILAATCAVAAAISTLIYVVLT
jgi:uncharacterized protein YceH (UPF0502 family)